MPERPIPSSTVREADATALPLEAGSADLVDARRPLEDYFRAIEEAGLLVDRLREIPDSSEVPADASLRWRRIPLFLHLRAGKS